MRTNTRDLDHIRHVYALVTLPLFDVYQHDIVFIDECSVNAGMVRNYAWAKVRAPATILHQDKKDSLTVIVAVTRHGVIHIDIRSDTTTSIVFQDYLVELLDKIAVSEIGNVIRSQPFVILDNAPPHKAYATRDEFERLGIRALTLPPYTPSFNPAEQFFRSLKSKLRVDLAQRR